MRTEKKCPLCKMDVDSQQQSGWVSSWLVPCLRCGTFEIEDILWDIMDNTPGKFTDKLHLLSGLTKRQWLRTKTPLRLEMKGLDRLLASPLVPTTPTQRIDRIVEHAAWASQSSFGKEQLLDPTEAYPLAFARDADEFRHLCEAAEEEERLIKPRTIVSPSEVRLRLTLRGWRHAEELEKVGAASNQAFVAMWFHEDMDEPYDKAIMRALKATGYRPLCLKYLRHNNKIDNRIILEIRRSGLVVADFTENRQSVYLEAGFADGLGIDVIRTCEEDHLDRLHFDNRQYNHVVWQKDKLGKFRDDLEEQIRATIPGRANAGPLKED